MPATKFLGCGGWHDDILRTPQPRSAFGIAVARICPAETDWLAEAGGFEPLHLRIKNAVSPLLDPHNLGALSFSIIEQLAKLKYIDILVHVSVSDLQRNVDLYSSEVQRQFNEFAPEWRKHVSLNAAGS
jgi:hypothetical protein